MPPAIEYHKTMVNSLTQSPTRAGTPQQTSKQQPRGSRCRLCCPPDDPSPAANAARTVSEPSETVPRKKTTRQANEPRGVCCIRDSNLPRGAQFGLCLGVFMLAAVGTALFVPWRKGNDGGKAERYENGELRFNPDMNPSYRPTRQPTGRPTSELDSPTRSPTVTPGPAATPTSKPTSPTIVNPPGTVVDRLGHLWVDENGAIPQIRSANTGEAVQLRGMSMFWSNTGYGAEGYWSKPVVRFLVANWNITLIRCAMGVEDAGGYVDDPTANRGRVDTVIEAALEYGVYVIVDWHSHEAENVADLATSFFTDVNAVWGHYPNVIFEIYNEPIRQSWPETVKPYHEDIIPVIRRTGNQNLVLLGSPDWSQQVDVAAADKVDGYANLVYVFHFYAATHGSWLRDAVDRALAQGVAVFCSEWGTVRASGDGEPDVAATQAWIQFMKERNISWANWAVNDKDEGASILRPGTPAPDDDDDEYSWADDDYTASGLVVRALLRDP